MLSKGRATEPKVKTDLHSSISSHAGQNVPVQVVGASRRHHSSDVPAPQEGQARQPQLADREQPKVVRGENRARIVRCHGRGRWLAAVHASIWSTPTLHWGGESASRRQQT